MREVEADRFFFLHFPQVMKEQATSKLQLNIKIEVTPVNLKIKIRSESISLIRHSL